MSQENRIQWQNPKTGQWVLYDRNEGQIKKTSDTKFEGVKTREKNTPIPGKNESETDNDTGIGFF